MSDPFLGEIRMAGFNFAPQGWATCDGQILPISQNTALFSLLGTNFGGNGTSNFGLPDLRGRSPICWQQGPGLSDYFIGEDGGLESETLLSTECPTHTHQMNCNKNAIGGNQQSPVNHFPAIDGQGLAAPFATAANNTNMAANALSPVGNGQSHENRMPFLVVNFIIAMSGIFPTRG